MQVDASAVASARDISIAQTIAAEMKALRADQGAIRRATREADVDDTHPPSWFKALKVRSNFLTIVGRWWGCSTRESSHNERPC